MNNKIYFSLLLCASAVFSCKTPRTTVVRPYDKDYPDSTLSIRVPLKLPAMELATDSNIVYLHMTPPDGHQNNNPQINIRYIPLETTDECRIKEISKMESDDSILFICDYNGQKALRFSERDGSFLTKFNIPEQKAYKYTPQITNMGVDKKRKEVCLIDNVNNQLFYFAYDGTFLYEKPIYYFYNDIQYVGNNLILHTGRNDNSHLPVINNHRVVLARHDQTPLGAGFFLPDTYKCRQDRHRGF